MKKYFNLLCIIALVSFVSCEQEYPDAIGETFIKFDKSSISNSFEFDQTATVDYTVKVVTLGALNGSSIEAAIATPVAGITLTTTNVDVDPKTGEGILTLSVDQSTFSPKDKKTVGINLISAGHKIVKSADSVTVKFEKKDVPVFSLAADVSTHKFELNPTANFFEDTIVVSVDKKLYTDVTVNLAVDFTDIDDDMKATEIQDFTLLKSVVLKKGATSVKVPYKVMNTNLFFTKTLKFDVKISSQVGITQGATLGSTSISMYEVYDLQKSHWNGDVKLVNTDNTNQIEAVSSMIEGTSNFNVSFDFSNEFAGLNGDLDGLLLASFDNSDNTEPTLSFANRTLKTVDNTSYWTFKMTQAATVVEVNNVMIAKGLKFEITQFDWDFLKDADGNFILNADEEKVKGWVKNSTASKTYENYSFSLR